MKVNVRPIIGGRFELIDGNIRVHAFDRHYQGRDYILETNCGPIKRSQLTYQGDLLVPLVPADEAYQRRMRDFEITACRTFKCQVGHIWEAWNDQRLTSTQAMIEKLTIQFDIDLSEREAEINAEARC